MFDFLFLLLSSSSFYLAQSNPRILWSLKFLLRHLPKTLYNEQWRNPDVRTLLTNNRIMQVKIVINCKRKRKMYWCLRRAWTMDKQCDYNRCIVDKLLNAFVQQKIFVDVDFTPSAIKRMYLNKCLLTIATIEPARMSTLSIKVWRFCNSSIFLDNDHHAVWQRLFIEMQLDIFGENRHQT